MRFSELQMEWKPTFIGNFRSGTTLLANLLGLHPELATWFETKMFCEALRWVRVLNDPATEPREQLLIRPDQAQGFSARAVYERMRQDLELTAARLAGQTHSGKGAHEHYPVGHDAVAYSLPQGQAALDDWYRQVMRVPNDAQAILKLTGELIGRLGELHAGLAGKPCWVNKTPEIPRFAEELRGALGQTRIILMIRDGRAVVRSASALGWASEERLAVWWKQMILETREAMRDYPKDYLEVKYEELIAQPEQVLDQVLAFMGLQPMGAALWQRYREGVRLPLPTVHQRQPAAVSVDEALLRLLGYC